MERGKGGSYGQKQLDYGIQDIADEDYVGSVASLKARSSFGRRDAFFRALRYEMSRYLHENWRHLLLAIAGGTRWLNSGAGGLFC
jgi:hypothetical protein